MKKTFTRRELVHDAIGIAKLVIRFSVEKYGTLISSDYDLAAGKISALLNLDIIDVDEYSYLLKSLKSYENECRKKIVEEKDE